MQWERDGRDWPNRESSRFVNAGGLTWHVQVMGNGPVLLLLHGTGASNHSWRDVAPLLADHFTVIAPDLPGHGFSSAPSHWSLPSMAASMAQLLTTLGLPPTLGVGHSAGAAILARMSLDSAIDIRALIAVNGALLPLRGLAGRVFSPLAKLLALNPLVPRVFAWRASQPDTVGRLIDQTGSHLDARGLALYERLVRDPAHCAAALNMMAHWDLESLARDVARLRPTLCLVVGERDLTVSPHEAERLQARCPRASVVRLPALGHLAHE